MKRILLFLSLIFFIASDLKSQQPFKKLKDVSDYVTDSVKKRPDKITANTLNKAYQGIIEFMPSVSDTGSVTSPKHGYIRFQTSDSAAYVYDTTATPKRWRRLVPNTGGGGSDGNNYTSSLGFSSDVLTVGRNGLSNLTVPIPISGKVDSTVLRNDSLFQYKNGVATFRGKAVGSGGITKAFDSLKQHVDTAVTMYTNNGDSAVITIKWYDGNLGAVTTSGNRSHYELNDGVVTLSKLSSALQTLLNGKLDSVTLRNDSLFQSKNGTTTYRGKASGGGGTVVSGSVNDFRELKLLVGKDAYNPANGDSFFVYSNYANKKLNIFREGEFQYDSTSAGGYGYRRNVDTIFFYPPLTTNERIVIQAYPDSNWTNDVLSAPAGYDADAQTYFNAIAGAGGSLTNTQKTAYNNFILALKSAGIFSTHFDGLYILCGGSDAASKFNIISPLNTDAAYRLTFNNSATFASTGVTGNGTNQTISSHFIPGLAAKLSQNDAHIAVYHRTSAGADNPVWGINQLGSQIYLFPKESGGAGSLKFINAITPFTPANAKGFWLVRRNTTNIQLYKDGTNITDNLDNGAGDVFSSTYDIVFNGWNNNGTPALAHAGEISIISFGKYLNDTQRAAYETAVANLVTALGL